MSQVETVRGPVDVQSLGATLMHEHIVNVTHEVAHDYPHLSWPEGRDAVVRSAVRQLQAVKESGIDTVVDATAFGHGRDVALVKRVNEQVDINIVVSTGYYTYGEAPFFVHLRPPAGRDVLVDMFVHDIREGVAETGVKAGLIKCATDRPGMTPVIERVLRACARAHRETGVPISTHTVAGDRNGLDQQRIFTEEGVDLTRVIIGHSGDSTDIEYLKRLMDAGSVIGADRFGLYGEGFPDMQQRVATVARLCELGYADRIVLSHDYTIHTDWYDLAAPPIEMPAVWVQTHISGDVLPALREHGVTDEQIDMMLVGNPARVLGARGGY
ncbi:phosphotriesterase family protein [Capillimicrobium parvum]|uniref:Phosphotriesterase homology protein n=1 Tax=Capillimicrobium parvum TaxID=2884022 RepID=A0A9E6XRR9_9ACTN|nr:Phosphotriesterase homology protein [Capillimicrobium parvum]